MKIDDLHRTTPLYVVRESMEGLMDYLEYQLPNKDNWWWKNRLPTVSYEVLQVILDCQMR
jgi:hypothetical protein